MSVGNCQLIHSGAYVDKERDTWSSVFVSQVNTEEKSILFVKRLVSIIVSSVTYLRGLFPEDAYEEKTFDGLVIKNLLWDSKLYSPAILVRCLTGAFEAIEKRYVDELRFVIYDDVNNPECLREAYAMKFTYATDGSACVVTHLVATTPQRTLIDLRGSTQRLLRTLIVLTQSLEALPEQVFAAIRLTYREETPLTYDPPWFYTQPSEELIFPTDSVNVKVGAVNTLHHKVSVSIKASNQILRVAHTSLQPKVSSLAFIRSQSLVACSEEPLPPADPTLRRRRQCGIHKILNVKSRGGTTRIREICDGAPRRGEQQEVKHPSNPQNKLGTDVDVLCPCRLRGVGLHLLQCPICKQHAPQDVSGEHLRDQCGRLGHSRTDPLCTPSRLTKITLKPSVREQLKTPSDTPTTTTYSEVVSARTFSSQDTSVEANEQQSSYPRIEDIVWMDEGFGRKTTGGSEQTKASILPIGLHEKKEGDFENSGKVEDGKRGKYEIQIPHKRPR
ncbi:uncharacterized protein LOC122260314 [Penaeus japonicus]|uniref:uncharacterized protein LOC122252717 n=1 Tax=Penaeus japonicus TaxID=27405 RepID=UPI001C70BA09|nr:uncharacterized protein LOC122252717 [Penaeus japonicus]XP_042871264.1 uncharacterized protein LOC122252717 [Penaeus japonicus]XP_042883469.1 uncharacterized protein LOC122260314 [Penaeus japonicus]XP_042883470.1 uncharacterized protein LOC122260314 [Penaeus japonicus]